MSASYWNTLKVLSFAMINQGWDEPLLPRCLRPIIRTCDDEILEHVGESDLPEDARADLRALIELKAERWPTMPDAQQRAREHANQLARARCMLLLMSKVAAWAADNLADAPVRSVADAPVRSVT